MPAATPGRIVLACILGIVTLWMDSLPSPFTIEIDGTPIAKVRDSAKDKTQAELGSEAAVFSLKDSRLRSGDWYLGRNLTENRSMLPKEVYWFEANEENEKCIHAVTAKKNGQDYEVYFANDPLMETEKKVFADLMQDAPAKVKVIFQG